MKDILTDVKRLRVYKYDYRRRENYAGPLNRRIEFVEKRIRDSWVMDYEKISAELEEAIYI